MSLIAVRRTKATHLLRDRYLATLAKTGIKVKKVVKILAQQGREVQKMIRRSARTTQSLIKLTRLL